MSKDSVSEWDTSAAGNEDVGGTNISATGNVSEADDAMRKIMAQIAAYTRAGADVASATTLNLDAADYLVLDVTGTTTTTAITLTAGHVRFLRAAAAWPITAGASLIVNGSNSVAYTCEAGDLLFARGYAAGVVRIWVTGRDAALSALAALAVTDGNFAVGNGTTWVAESGATARTSLGLGTGDSPQFTAIELGHASDTTLARSGAGVMTIEGVEVTTNSGTQTLTNKTLTSPTVSGGTINNNIIGGSTPAAGTFTSLTTTGAFTSLGIDDNATAERLQLSDTVATVGSGAGYQVLINSGADVSPSSSADGQIKVQGSGYAGYLAMDATGLHFGHNAGTRNLTIDINETPVLTFATTGVATFTGASLVFPSGNALSWNAGDTTLTQSSGNLALGGSATDVVLDLSGANAGQIKFPATQNASSDANMLDDYREFTWTSTAAFATPGTSSWAYGSQSGRGTKIGRVVQWSNFMAATPTIGTGSGIVTISGFPYNAAVSIFGGVVETNSQLTFPAGTTAIYPKFTSGAATYTLRATGSATTATDIAASNMTSGNSHNMQASGCIEVQ